MKTININSSITTDQLYNILQEKLNPMFQRQRQSDISFKIEKAGGFVEIYQPELYEGFLFRIETKGTEVMITRSEHYVDDVNSLTLESVLHTLFDELSGDKGSNLAFEG